MLAHVRAINPEIAKPKPINKLLKNIDKEEVSWWEEHILWNLERYYNDIRYNLKKIKWFFQRGKRGYADVDLWCFDQYLAEVIRDGLNDLADNLYGWPAQLKEFPKFIDWKRKVKAISKAFGEWMKLNDDELIKIPKTKATKKEWDEYFKKYKAEQKRLGKEMSDLIKYFGYFWD